MIGSLEQSFSHRVSTSRWKSGHGRQLDTDGRTGRDVDLTSRPRVSQAKSERSCMDARKRRI